MKKNLKIIIPVAIFIIALVIVGIIVVKNKGTSVDAKENKIPEVVYKIGDTIQNENFEMTLKSVEFVDFINLSTQIDPKDNQHYYGTERFCLPIDQSGDNKVKVEEIEADSTIIAYTLEYKFIGKNKFETGDLSLSSFSGGSVFAGPIVKYDDEYTFDTSYFSTIKNNENGWVILNSDGTIKFSKTYWSVNEYKPLEDKIYQVRGFIVVPSKIKNDTEKPLTIQFKTIGDSAYKIR